MNLDWQAAFGILVIPVSIAFAIGLSLGYPHEPFVVLSIFLGTISIGLVIAIFAIQQSQGSKIKDLILNVGKTSREQSELIKGVRDVYASSFVHWVHSISQSYEHVIKLYEKNYLGSPNLSQKKETARNNLIDYYDRHLITWFPKIELMELVKTFGKKIANNVWRSQTHLNAQMWQPSDDKGMKLMIDDYKEQVKKAVILKDKFLPYCDDGTKTKDKSFQKYYDIINKESKSKPQNDSSSQELT